MKGSTVISSTEIFSSVINYSKPAFSKACHLVSDMPRRGNCWDNTFIESFHVCLKTEEFQYVKSNYLAI